MPYAVVPLRLFVAFVFLFLAGTAFAQPYTYTYFPSNTVINVPVTTDYAIIGYAGGIYNNDFTRNFTGPSSPTITIAPGADIPDAEVFNNSVVNVAGGSVGAVLYDTARVNVTGGTMPLLLGFDSAEIDVSGGTVPEIGAQCRNVRVMGGTVGIVEANVQSDPFGTNIGFCTTDVTGGTITGEVNAYNGGILNLRGGSIFGAKLKAAEGGILNIYGTGLAAQLLDPNAPNGYSLYTVSGLLSDGSPLDGIELRVRNDGVTYGHSSFNLINVPEPGTAGALGLGGLLAARRRRRRHRVILRV